MQQPPRRPARRTSGTMRIPRGARLPITLILVLLLVIGAGAIALLGPWRDVAAEDPTDASTSASEQPTASEEPTAEPSSEEPTTPAVEDAVFTIGAVGDVLPHDTPIATAAADAEGGGYDFRPMLEATRPYSEGVDLMLCNFEVPLSQPGETPSGYPSFGAPAELVGNLADLGYDGCSTGTNHTLDRGADNAEYTLDVFDESGLGHAGSARSQTEADAPQLYEIERGGQTITVAQLGGSYGTNGIPIPGDSPWVINTFSPDIMDPGNYDPSELIAQATAAREAGADLVVATIHWGVEYQLSPNVEQTAMAQALAESGQIDLVVGTHPHVPQPFEKLDGGPDGSGMWVAWSLGNFISNQDSNCCISETATGLFMTATVTAPADGPARVSGMTWTPITVDRVGQQRAYPLLDLVNDERPGILALSEATLQQRLSEVEAIMSESTGAEFPVLDAPSTPTGEPPAVIPRPR
ncbi:CapA family protein [Pseudactinotalea suaedae]|uniref:CapA family protein n=1 Tax=Pseudactinotalea suaedae TaxID=1524924 RepID=UPI001391D0E4|nr:CapA family protein [Pseudactinotalea suaedae]